MIKQLKSFTLRLIGGANIATILCMLVVGFSSHISPVSHPRLSSLGLLFPIFPLINLCFLAFWLMFKKRGAIIPVLGFLLCFLPIRTYCPFNPPKSPPKDAMKVISFNVHQFAAHRFQGSDNPILKYLHKENADIVCLQEAYMPAFLKEEASRVIDPLYAYSDTARVGKNGDFSRLYSRYPIIKKQHLFPAKKTMTAVAYWLQLDDDTLCVVNCHLQITGLSEDEREGLGQLVKGEMKGATAKRESRKLFDQLGKANASRATQVKRLKEFIQAHASESILLCGDFNDNPISYTHHVLSELLNDCFVSSGNGPGFTYHEHGLTVRIDHMMCSEGWKPYGCKVDRSIGASDHYPLVCWLKKDVDAQK